MPTFALPEFVANLHLKSEAYVALVGIVLILALRALSRDRTARRGLVRAGLYLLLFLALFGVTVAVEPNRANLHNLLDDTTTTPTGALQVTLNGGGYTSILAGGGQLTFNAGTAGTTGLPCTVTASTECEFAVNVGGTVLATHVVDPSRPTTVMKLVQTPNELLAKIFGVLAAIAFLVGVFRLVGAVFFDVFLLLHKRFDPPRILRDIAKVIGWAIGLAIIMDAVGPPGLFHDILATYGIIGAVVGFAVQAPLGNLFGGLVLELEKPFALGDKISLDALNGEVVDTTWRSTKIKKGSNDVVIVPNSTLLNGMIVNHLEPRPPLELTIGIDLPYDVSPAHAKRTLVHLTHVERSVLTDPAPQALLHSFGESTIHYDLSFAVPANADAGVATDRVLTAIWFRFRRDGIPIANATLGVDPSALKRGLPKQSADDIAGFLGQVEFLRPLGDAERKRLASALRSEWYAEGEYIVRKGDPDSSCFLLMEGTALLYYRTPAEVRDGAEPDEKLAPGAFFGELALLTNEPHLATVIAERHAEVLVIDRATFRDVLQSNQRVAAEMSEILARTRTAIEARRSATPTPTDEHVAQASNDLLGKIRAMFDL
jgi:small-conductance mechanosensitive channel/CRP-like cAMP-binding protein